uniref:Bifunctional epoxide hydrolase 2-like n=1 Tax=Tanacetum cinerariifolium TaxID=118510 RepID=A0A699IPI1_TANCI|nr:hypothetical protein [Tanacetum cinerariifolium]
MMAVANAGFRVIAHDFRGLSESHAEPEKASFAHLISDTAFILDALAISKVFVIASENEEIMDLVTPLPSWSLDMVGSEVQVPKVEAKTVLIIGEKDYVLKIPGMDEYVRSGEAKKYVPNQEPIYVPHGSHFVQEQFPNQINQLMITYLHNNKHLTAVCNGPKAL